MNISQRDIVLLPFPYSNLSFAKKRPALVISSNEFNNSSNDIVCCLITSNPENEKHCIFISNNDMDEGNLKVLSKIKTFRIFSAEKTIIYKKIGKIKKEKLNQVIAEINKIIK